MPGRKRLKGFSGAARTRQFAVGIPAIWQVEAGNTHSQAGDGTRTHDIQLGKLTFPAPCSKWSIAHSILRRMGRARGAAVWK